MIILVTVAVATGVGLGFTLIGEGLKKLFF